MEIVRETEISEKYAKAVMDAEPGSKQAEDAMNAYIAWSRMQIDKEKAEEELRIKRNVRDDQTLKDAEELEATRKRDRIKMWTDIAGLTISGIGTLVMAWALSKSVRAETDNGEPVMGIAKRLVDRGMNTLGKR